MEVSGSACFVVFFHQFDSLGKDGAGCGAQRQRYYVFGFLRVPIFGSIFGPVCKASLQVCK